MLNASPDNFELVYFGGCWLAESHPPRALALVLLALLANTHANTHANKHQKGGAA